MTASILGSISTGVSRTGLRIVIAGQEKMGKTTMCAGAPGALLIPLEVGYAGVSVPKTKKLETLSDVHLFLDETTYYAQRGQFPYKTLAFDSATAMERLIHESVIERDPLSTRGGKKMITMDSSHGGYGKGYSMANDEFDSLLAKLDVLAVQGGMNIVLTCHVFSSKTMDPTAGEYDTWDLLLHSPKNQKTYGKRERLTQWADIIGFLYEPLFVSKSDNLSKAISQNKGRMLGLSRTPSYVAGNRFGISGEVAIPAPPNNGWNALAHAVHAQTGIDIFNRT
jgi:AAA domain